MAVVVIDTIKPKNQGTFPVVEAADVKVTNDKRLDAALNDKANQSDLTALSETVSGKASQSDLTALSNTVEGKQDALSSAQLTAINSGITSELVTQIGTNTTAIAGKADATDLTALNAEVDNKADESDLTTATASLQAQIDNIVSGSTADSEVINARVGTDGTIYNTLKARLDAEENDNQNKIANLRTDVSEIEDIIVPMIGINLFNINDTELGFYLNYTDGTKSTNVSYGESNYIKVKPQTDYYASDMGAGLQVCYYNDEKEFISGSLINSSSGGFTTPAGCAYIRANYMLNKTECQITEGDTAQPYEPYHLSGYKFIGDGTADAQVSAAKVSISGTTYNTLKARLDTELTANLSGIAAVQGNVNAINDIIIPVLSTNLFNINDTEEGYYLNYLTGEKGINAEFGESNYIEVEAETTYYGNNFGAGWQICFYNQNKQFISGVLMTTEMQGIFTTPANTVYLRTCYALAKTNIQLSKGSSAVPYEPYKFYGYTFANTRFDKNILVVSKTVGAGYYNSLTAAVADATDGAIIYVEKGIYTNENVKAWGKNITIIGEDMQNTIIVNELNDYYNPPIEFSVGNIENITFYAKDGGAEPQGWTAYGCHIEHNSLTDSKLTFRNCTFKSDYNAGVGMGLRKGCNVIFDNCAFESRDTYAVFFHDSNGTAGTQNVMFKNCTMLSHTGSSAMRIDSQRIEGSTINCTFISNILACDAVDVANVSTHNAESGATREGTLYDLINFFKTKLCFGNNISGLNL